MGMIPNSMAWHATIWADAQPKFVQLPLEVKLQFVRDPKIYFYDDGVNVASSAIQSVRSSFHTA